MARIRPATAHDYDSIVSWTRETFSWGDYVPDRFHTWLEEPNSELLTCVDDEDKPIAVANVIALSTNEGWMEAARVHPDHRREGLGSALNHAGVEWARQRGCRVMRLTTETDNTPAMRQVETLGYRSVSKWFYSAIEIAAGHRCDERFRLRPSTISDAEAAWISWSQSRLARQGRDLIALGWRWRMAQPDDVLGAAQRGELFHAAAGWASVGQRNEDWLETRWMATTPEDILPLLEGLIDLASSRGLERLTVKLPDTGWTREAVRRFGGGVARLIVWAKPI